MLSARCQVNSHRNDAIGRGVDDRSVGLEISDKDQGLKDQGLKD
jgi:hypothetical protein